MKTKDVRALPPELRELAKLALSFKNKCRNDSDTAVVRMILALYDDTKRKVQVRIVSWALKVMRHDVVSSLARPVLVDFLMSDKVTLSEKQLKRYERAQAEAAAPKVKGKKKYRVSRGGQGGLPSGYFFASGVSRVQVPHWAFAAAACTYENEAKPHQGGQEWRAGTLG